MLATMVVLVIVMFGVVLWVTGALPPRVGQ